MSDEPVNQKRPSGELADKLTHLSKRTRVTAPMKMVEVADSHAQVYDFLMEGEDMVLERFHGLKLLCSMLKDVVRGFVPHNTNTPEALNKHKKVLSNLRLYNLLAREGVPIDRLLLISVTDARASVEWREPPPKRFQYADVPEDKRLKTNGRATGFPKEVGVFVQLGPEGDNTLYVARHTIHHEKVLMKWRGVDNLNQILPSDAHRGLRVVKNLDVYQEAIDLGFAPKKAFEHSPAELRRVLANRLTHCQMLVLSTVRPNLNVSEYVKEHELDYGALTKEVPADTLFLELLTWVSYLRTGDYSTVEPLSPFYYDVVIKLTGDEPLFDSGNPFHVALVEDTGIESYGANFLINVNRLMPWHPPILANPVKVSTDRVISQSVPTWPLTSHWEIKSFFEFAKNASRFSKYFNDALKRHEDHRIMKDQFARLMKTNKKIFVSEAKNKSKPLKFNPNIKTLNTFNVCVKVEFEHGGPYGQLTCFASKLRQDRGSLNQMVFNTGDKNSKIEGLVVNVIMVYADKPSLRKYVNVPSSKLPTLTREECIAIFTLGRRLFSTYEPKLYHIDKFEMDQFKKA